MNTRTARRWVIMVAGTLLLGTAGASAASAADPAPIGPPLSQILATNPPPAGPSAGIDAAPNNCPAASYGVHSVAPGSGKTVALTFDDGPGPSTAAIVSILTQQHITATFFNLGVNIAARPQELRSEASLGFSLGNHTWDHPEMPKLPAAGQASEMDKMTNEQLSVIGTYPCSFRPPYGEYNTTTLQLAQARKMVVWNWSVDTEDWKAAGSGSSYWVDRITSRAIAGASQSHPVILMHNSAVGNPATVAALPAIISYYRSHGYSFVNLAGSSRPVAESYGPGMVRGNEWLLRDTTTTGAADVSFSYGSSSDHPIVGDWDGTGTFTPGVVRGNHWFLRDSNTAGEPDISFYFGSSTDKPVVGDWDGNGSFTPGVVRGNEWFLRNSNSAGPPDMTFYFGSSMDKPVVGDWDGNGTFTPGVVRGFQWYLRNFNSGGPAQLSFPYGDATDQFVPGDWDGNGTTTPGVVRAGNQWLLRNSNSQGSPNLAFSYGSAGDKPVTGNWSG